MTWRAFSYTLMVLLAVIAVATTASLGVSPEGIAPAQQAPALAVQSIPQTDPGTRLVVLVVGILATIYTFRRALLNMRSQS